jgi:hypothetical protein
LKPTRPQQTPEVVDLVKGRLDPATKGRKAFTYNNAGDAAGPRLKHE